MKESVAISKEANRKKESSHTRSDNSIPSLRNEPERQLGSLRDVIGNIKRNGGTPTIESLSTELSVMPYSDRASALLALQQTHGNQYVQRVVTGIQAKLKVGQPGDKYEQEADRVAEQVMQMPEPQVQRQAEEEEKKKEEEELIQIKPIADQITPLIQRQIEEEEEILQTKNVSNPTPEVTPDLESRINAMRGGGQPLPESARDFFEPRFGYDFSGVRVHTNAHSAKLVRSMNARAFTVGRDVVFGSREYAPDSNAGKRLLAHELAHVVQQSNGSVTAQMIQLDPLDDIRRELHRMPPPTTREGTREERRAIWERRERLRNAFGSVEPSEAQSIYDRLRERRRGDELSMRFHDMLAYPTREEMLEILQRRIPIRVEMEEERIEVPPRTPTSTACYDGTTVFVSKNRRMDRCPAVTGTVGAPTPNGRYCIRRQGEAQISGGIAGRLLQDRSRWYLLEPQFSTTRYRMQLHPGGMSAGCVTVTDSACFNRLASILNSSGTVSGFGYDGYPPGNAEGVSNPRRNVSCVGWLLVNRSRSSCAFMHP